MEGHMKCFIVFLLFIYTIQAISDRVQWKQFKIKYKKNYATDKYENHRFQIFQENLRIIEEHNEKFFRDEVTYQLGVSRFADMSQEEIFSSAYGTRSPKKRLKETNAPSNVRDVPDSIDWRSKGAVTEVKDSGECVRGSWAFAATAAVESRLYVLNETLVSLSSQNLLDCDQYSYGCKVGEMDSGFIYIHSSGVTTEEKYPFTGIDGDCIKNEIVYKASTQEWDGNGEEFLWGIVGRFGPAAVIIDGACLFLYKAGIIEQECGCRNDYYRYEMNALVVGYGTENDTDFWILKHSWGTEWGEQGYFRLRRNFNTTCGIGNQLFLVLEVF